MGGLLFLIAPLVALALAARRDRRWRTRLLIAGSAAIGLHRRLRWRSRRGRNRGLRARTKFLATALVGAAFLVAGRGDRPGRAARCSSSGRCRSGCGIALSLAVILATTHAVNLTDGLDGLAAGTIVPPLARPRLRRGAAGRRRARRRTPPRSWARCSVSSLYNRHPAKIFMGDTGSLALGAALAGAAILTGAQLLLPLIGGVFVAETLSVIVQVASYQDDAAARVPDEPAAPSLRTRRLARDEGDGALLVRLARSWVSSASSSWCVHEHSDSQRTLRSQRARARHRPRPQRPRERRGAAPRVAARLRDRRRPARARSRRRWPNSKRPASRSSRPTRSARCCPKVTVAVLSPGIPLNGELVRRIQAAGVPVFSEVEVAYRICKAPIVALTGTKGKIDDDRADRRDLRERRARRCTSAGTSATR